MNIGSRIKNRRRTQGLSVDEVAAALGKHRATIYRYESNEIEDLPLSIIEPLAKVLCTTPAYLMGWDDSPTNCDDDNLISSIKPSSLEYFDEDAKKSQTDLNIVDDDETLVILNRNAKKLSKKDREKLLDMAKVMFKEEFDD